ncbi:MAG: hypothetical protein LN568_01445 [Rickettsia endosymbiont of Pseudomimeciton antennatum]|nr:hypothetical protein [Rickettsia endosymbiont of Pseudomimeciton antennatum]MCC8397777.1 hypothetical protein [Rickettsia endosymbiont of Labidopullus appendiculatus]
MSKMNVENNENSPWKQPISIVMRHGVSFGSALAMAISFNINHSVLWAILHGLFSWLYVAYYCLV